MEAEREAEWIAGAWVKIASKCPSYTSTRKPLAFRRELKQRVLQEVRRILRKVLKKAAASNRLEVLDREANLVRCRATPQLYSRLTPLLRKEEQVERAG